MDRQQWTEWSQGCDLQYTAVDSLMRNNAMARRMARRPGEDSNREGHRVQGSVQGQALDVLVGGPPQDKAEAPDPLATWAEKFGLVQRVVEADSQARAHGMSLWVYGLDDGQTSDKPLDLRTLTRLMWVRTISRQRVSVHAWEERVDSPRFGKPSLYQVSFARGGSALFHWTRTWAWDGVEISDEEREQTQDYGGGSVFDLVWSELRNYGVSQGQAIEALSRLSQAVWKNDNLARAVDGGDAAAAAQHYERLAYGGGPFGDYALAEGEEYSIVGRPISGVDGLIKVFQSAMVAASEQPEPVLLGAQPTTSGLNSESDGLIRAWYDHLASQQPGRFSRPLNHFWSLASRTVNGPTGGVPILDLQIGWPSLWQLTPAEKATIRKTNADARSVDLASQAITTAEARTDTTLADEYELAPDEVIAAAQPEVAIEELEVADDGEMPLGETPISLSQAKGIIGVKTNGGVRGFIGRTGVPLFKPGGQFRVFESHLRAAMRESRV